MIPNITLDDVELRYIKDIRRKNNTTGIGFTKEARERMAAERALDRFLCRMNIVILNLILKRRPRK